MIYKTGSAFRRALEDRLLAESVQTGAPLMRLRKMVAFDRFLARLQVAHPGDWLLKGGLALQLRLGLRARTTLDVDVLFLESADRLHEMLVGAARVDLMDWFELTVRATGAQLPGMTGALGQRFAITSLLDGRTFEAFHLDVGLGDPVIEPPDSLTPPPLLAFAGIAPTPILCYPVTQHLAEKVHAYLRPHASGANTRVKDLVDIVLLAQQATVDATSLRSALVATFGARGEEHLPDALPDPPAGWERPYHRLAADVGLVATDLQSAITVARRFVSPVLTGEATGVWQPGEQVWA